MIIQEADKAIDDVMAEVTFSEVAIVDYGDRKYMERKF